MIRSITGLCMGLTFLTLSAFAQSTNTVRAKYIPAKTTRPLTVGDKVPDFPFPEMMNYSASSGRLSDFRADLTILDFWSTSCSVCVDQFAKMQHLKDRFGSRLQIILVNSQTKLWHDDAPKITNLLTRFNKNRGIKITLPVVLNATALDDAFPHNSMPHEVWINKNGIVLAVTGHLEVTDDIVASVLAGNPLKMHLKTDAQTSFEKTTLQDWYYAGHSPTQSIIGNSLIVKGFIDGGNGEGVRRDAADHSKIVGWFCINRPLFYLFYDAYINKITVPWNQVLYEGPDTALFSSAYPKDSSLYNHVYSYDITVPPSSFNEIHEFIQQDLKRAFGYVVKNTRREMQCIIIKPGGNLKLSDTASPPRWEMTDNSHYNGVSNYPLSEVLLTLNRYSKAPMLLAEGANLKLDITLPANVKDPVAIRKSLEDAGLLVTDEHRVIDVAIITRNQ